MSDDEKKISLNELPDEGSSSEIPKPSVASAAKKTVKSDPRIERLKNLSDEEKSQKMTQKWLFDVPDRNWTWLWVVAGLFLLEQLHIYERYLVTAQKMSEATMGFSEVITDMMELIDYFILHPFLLAIFVPLFFKFSQRSPHYFELSFDGIHTTQKTVLKKGEMPARVRIKWAEIDKVNKTVMNKREVLELHSPSGKIGELIWNLENHQKAAIKQLIKGILNPKNPFRLFIEKEVS